jgi:aspartyl aminopeptidase
MPITKDSNPDHAQNGEGRLLRNFILLALPWLAFQREILAIMKKGIEDASHVRPVENLTSREMQALMMIVDPSGKWRSLLDRDLEKKIQETYTATVPKFVSGSIQFIDAQDKLLASISDLLGNLRKDNKASGHTSGKTTD